MKRSVALLAAGGVASLGLALLAPAAYAGDVTNPAEHPYKVTVTIDGQEYTDGQDTLPGSDDYACTAIPNVQFDFADNEIDYYDDDGNLLATAPWTEWSRITSYQTWLKQQQAASSSAAHSTSAAPATHSTSATPKPTATHSSAAAAGSSTKKANSTKHSSAAAPAAGRAAGAGQTASESTGSTESTSSAAAATSGSAVVAAAVTGAPSRSGAAVAASGDGTVQDTQVAQSTGAASSPALQPVAQSLGHAVADGLGKGSGNTRLGGAAVLAVLAVAAVLLLAGNGVRRWIFGRGGNGAHL